MSKRTKVWLLLAIIVTVHLIYVVGIAAFLASGSGHVFILNWLNAILNLISGNDTDLNVAVMNLTALLCIVLWICWGVSFIRDE